MTIASCYVSSEGVVFGADSTTTYNFGNGDHYYNHAQKLFEIGSNSSLGIVVWGLGGFDTSYRKLLAILGDDLAASPPMDVHDVANRWAHLVWPEYTSGQIGSQVSECKRLSALAPYDPTVATPGPGSRTKDEEELFFQLRNVLKVGFCIGGYVLPARKPEAYVISLDPLATSSSLGSAAQGWSFWGAPNMIKRLIFGLDDGLKDAILKSGHWSGTPADLSALASRYELAHPNNVPMREAIDFVYSCIASTIKALKFSTLPPICGGPIEIAVVTVDRNFRWVRHKQWDAAITESGS